MEERAKRKLSAILSADVKGYSRLMQEDELVTIRTLEDYRALMAEVIRKYRGRVVDSPGDNVLAEFASVVDAVESAVEIQKELEVKNAELSENRRMEFRIGVNLGDVVEEGERIYGDGVNIAARLEGLAEGGGICISRTAFGQVKNKLNLGYEYLGAHSVKNISEPVRVYRVLMEPEAAGKVIGEEKLKPRQWRWAAIGGVVVLILVACALAIWNFYFRPAFEPASPDRMAYPLPDKPSIAVLPFVNMSEDPKQEYFSDGLTEEIITALSRAPQLFVIARNSTFIYKGKPVKVKQVAEEFGVRYVLEGSVRKSEDRVRITAQLIDAIKGHHLWAERYDRDLKDIFAIQDEITMKIISALQVKLTRGDDERLYAKGTNNLEAYLKSLQSRELSSGAVTNERNALARRLAEEAIALDPNYTEGYRTLAETHSIDVWLGISKSPQESLKRGVELAQKAIALDNSNAHAHSLLATTYVMQRQHDKAIAAAERAYALEPNSYDVLTRYAWVLYYAGRWEEAVRLYEEGMRLSPITTNVTLRFYGAALRDLGRYNEAITVLKKAIEQEPRDLFAYLMLTVAYSLAGREEEARETAKEVLRINPKFSVEHLEETTPSKDPSHTARLTNAMRKAGLPEHPPLSLPDKPSIAVLPFVNMSGDPEQEYFSDGITEEIITALSKTPKLFVIARNSTFTYKGKPVKVQQVGRELGVRYVMEGSVRKAGEKVRITAQLVDAKTGHHLWAERYDREMKDIFVLQDEITMKIVAALRVRLTDGEVARMSAKRTDNLEAYLWRLQAGEQIIRMNREGVFLARQMAEKAIELDPKYGEAYHILASTYWLELPLRLTKDPRQSIARAMDLTQKAISLDKSYAMARSLLGMIYVVRRQHDKGILECERAISLEPNSAWAHYFLGNALRFAGRQREAIANLKEAIRLDPIPPSSFYGTLANSYCLTGQYEEAIRAGKEATLRGPDNVFAHAFLAAAYSLHGRKEDAGIEAREVFRISPKFSLENWAKAIPYKNEADRDLIIGAMRKAGLK